MTKQRLVVTHALTVNDYNLFSWPNGSCCVKPVPDFRPIWIWEEISKKIMQECKLGYCVWKVKFHNQQAS